MRALTPFLSFGLDSGNPYVDHLRGARPWKFSIFSFPTRLLSRAIEWNANDKNNSFVLRGDDLRSAERWLAEAGAEKERQPTAPQTEYIIAGRKAAARRQRITFGADREAWVDWKDIRVALAALEGSGYFKLESVE